jgi:hypothetical protein
MLSKKVFLPVTAIVLVAGLSFIGVSAVQAQTGSDRLSGLAQAIAQKFNLDQSLVQTTINDYNQQQKTNLQSNRLDQLVKDGNITDSQKQAILDELATLKSKYNPANWKDLTKAQRDEQIKAEQAEAKAWATSQGIDPTYVMPGFMGPHQAFGHFRKPTPTPTPTPSS